jgi:hypothetical protein
MRKLFTCLALILTFTLAQAQQKFGDFSKDFVKGYNALNLPQLELSYVSGLQHIGSVDNVQKQEDFFKSVKSALAAFKPNELTPEQKTDSQIISYETGLNLQRIELEKLFQKKASSLSRMERRGMLIY